MDMLDCTVLHLYHCDIPAAHHMVNFLADGLFSSQHTTAACTRKHPAENARRYAHSAAKRGDSPPAVLDLDDHASVQRAVTHGTAFFGERSKNAQRRFRHWVNPLQTSGLSSWVAVAPPPTSAPLKPKAPAQPRARPASHDDIHGSRGVPRDGDQPVQPTPLVPLRTAPQPPPSPTHVGEHLSVLITTPSPSGKTSGLLSRDHHDCETPRALPLRSVDDRLQTVAPQP